MNIPNPKPMVLWMKLAPAARKIMKRRFYALTLVVAMLAMTLVGCGSDTTTTNTQKEEQSVEQQEPIEEIIDADGTFEIKYVFVA